jgi:hypothetical protein
LLFVEPADELLEVDELKDGGGVNWIPGLLGMTTGGCVRVAV